MPTGEFSHNWKGGITSINKMERIRFYETIRLEVLARDKYKCRECRKSGHLHVDHIQPWKDYVEGRFDMENCRTLCDVCHYRITFGREMPKESKTWGLNLKSFIQKGGI